MMATSFLLCCLQENTHFWRSGRSVAPLRSIRDIAPLRLLLRCISFAFSCSTHLHEKTEAGILSRNRNGEARLIPVDHRVMRSGNKPLALSEAKGKHPHDRGGGFLECGAVRGDKVAVPATAIFEDTALRGIVDVDQAEAFAVAVRPLEVIHQRPDEVACQGDASGDGRQGFLE